MNNQPTTTELIEQAKSSVLSAIINIELISTDDMTTTLKSIHKSLHNEYVNLNRQYFHSIKD